MIDVGSVVLHDRGGEQRYVVVQVRGDVDVANDPRLGAFDFDLIPLDVRGGSHLYAFVTQLTPVPTGCGDVDCTCPECPTGRENELMGVHDW